VKRHEEGIAFDVKNVEKIFIKKYDANHLT
jgi:hypothetical protein